MPIIAGRTISDTATQAASSAVLGGKPAAR